MTAADWIDDLERKAKAATPGPWEATQEGLTHPNGWEIDAPDGPVVSECCGYRGSVGKTADAEFIAAANPATILRLIEENRRLVQVAQSDRETAQDFAEEVAATHAVRDALAAKVAAVEALLTESEAQDWTFISEVPLVEGDRLRAALSTAPTDTTKEN